MVCRGTCKRKSASIVPRSYRCQTLSLLEDEDAWLSLLLLEAQASTPGVRSWLAALTPHLDMACSMFPQVESVWMTLEIFLMMCLSSRNTEALLLDVVDQACSEMICQHIAWSHGDSVDVTLATKVLCHEELLSLSHSVSILAWSSTSSTVQVPWTQWSPNSTRCTTLICTFKVKIEPHF